MTRRQFSERDLTTARVFVFRNLWAVRRAPYANLPGAKPTQNAERLMDMEVPPKTKIFCGRLSGFPDSREKSAAVR
jgi:hypothetical protein